MTLPKRHHRPTATFTTVALVLLLAMTAMGCGTGDQWVGSGTTVEQTTLVPTTPPTTAARTPTATAQLQPFLDLAAAADRDLAEAAQRINAATTEETITYDERTVELLDVDFRALGNAVPAGMPAELEQSALLVYSDLVSRWGSLAGGDCPSSVGTRPRSEYTDNLCFVNGAPAAARFDGDLAALVAVADRTAAFVAAAPDSRAAEALAARIDSVDLRNLGCANTGGFVATEPITVTWDPSPGMENFPDWEGTVDGIPFYGVYDADTGWEIWINAC